MFKIGDYVVYGNTGICRVEDITSLNMNGSEKEYYVLVPAEGNNSRSFLPVDNTKVVIRPVLTKEQAMKALKKLMLPMIKPVTKNTGSLRKNATAGAGYPSLRQFMSEKRTE